MAPEASLRGKRVERKFGKESPPGLRLSKQRVRSLFVLAVVLTCACATLTLRVGYLCPENNLLSNVACQPKKEGLEGAAKNP